MGLARVVTPGTLTEEAFLDARGMRHISGSPTRMAARLRREVLERVGLPITVGVARTKFLAKVASGVAKPDGLLVVPPTAELGFLHVHVGLKHPQPGTEFPDLGHDLADGCLALSVAGSVGAGDQNGAVHGS